MPVNAVSSWGSASDRLPGLVVLRDGGALPPCPEGVCAALPHGMGRSYGDVCLNPGGVLWQTTALDHFISFDAEHGRLVCEAGTLLGDIQAGMRPRGWGLAVTPGTLHVTVGGAIANDVHGKNQAALGSFGNHVRSLRLLRTDGSQVLCGPEREPEMFRATVGGMGLTGVIVEAEIQLRRVPGPWLAAETMAFAGLDEYFDLAADAEGRWEHEVAWLDIASPGARRGIFMRANPMACDHGAPPPARRLGIPLRPPVSLVNGATRRILNTAYYHAKRWTAGARVVAQDGFLYPLDGVDHWNRIYGPRGMLQYQCLVPRGAEAAVGILLDRIAASREHAVLAILKSFGTVPSVGLMSFPAPGVTLAVDFADRGVSTRRLFDDLDAVLAEAGGRIYPAKDAHMSRRTFEAGYPALGEFLGYRDAGIRSGLSVRLMGD